MKSHGINNVTCELFLLPLAHESGVEKMFYDPPQTASDRNFSQYKYWYCNQKARMCGNIIKEWNSGAAQRQSFDKRKHQQWKPRNR
jgi:hypothetical protein